MAAVPGNVSIQRLLNLNSDDEEDPNDPEAYYQFPESLDDVHPFDFDPPDVQRINNIWTENRYIKKQYNEADLILSNPTICANAFNDDGPIGLLFLFMPSRFIDKYMLGATQEALNEKEPSRGGKVTFTVSKIQCVIGLDIAMSLNNNTTMKELWS